MPNRTGEFAESCKNVSASTSTTRNSAAAAAQILRKRKKRKLRGAGDVDVKDPDTDVWTAEACRVSSSLRSLSLFLASIRRAYLDPSSSSAYHLAKGKGTTRNDAGRGELDLSKGLLEAWRGVKWLDDRERDEVDWQAKTVLRRCMERLRELESAEKNRHAKAMHHLNRMPIPTLNKFLGLSAIQENKSQAFEEQFNAHRHQVSLFLSRQLMEVGRIQQEQQEVRVKRQLERQNLGPTPLGNKASHNRTRSVGKTFAQNENGGVPAIFVPAPINSNNVRNNLDGNDYDEEDEPIDALLTSAQIQQFESESSQLLQEANSQLADIEKAQTSLLEISNLQSELAVHLTQQMELTDKLWEDSVLVSGRVEEGNKQLRKARERNREGRLWLLVFLIGSSLSLLFLEYY